MGGLISNNKHEMLPPLVDISQFPPWKPFEVMLKYLNYNFFHENLIVILVCVIYLKTSFTWYVVNILDPYNELYFGKKTILEILYTSVDHSPGSPASLSCLSSKTFTPGLKFGWSATSVRTLQY